jgi:nicotinate-nucleotide adenylyltransferase
MCELQKTIDEVFSNMFGRTSLRERKNDILGEAIELTRATDIRNLKEETGDLLCSTIQSCTENGWTIEEVIQATLDKIEKRKLQYQTLGRKIKVALYGGAFNMIHKGHIDVAKIVLNHSSDFDEVWLVPCYEHLYGKKLASAEHRIEMCKIAARADARIKVCDYEIRNRFKGETYHFMKRIMNDPEYKDKYSFSLVIGLDNANTIGSWSNCADLLDMVPFITINRAKHKFEAKWCLRQPHRYIDPDVPPLDISSSILRNRFLEYYADKYDNIVLNSLKTYLENDIIEYILENNLYKE